MAESSRGAAPVRSVLLAGGGSAGHVNPLLAVAEELRRRDPDVRLTVLGTAEGLEARLVPERGLPLAVVPRVPLPRRPSADLLRLPGRLRAAVAAAGRAIDESGAQVVIGFGGYVSTPAYLAARSRHVPVVVHEQNARPGLANRLGARWAADVAVTFPGTPLAHAHLTGLPLRPEIADLGTALAHDRASTRAAAAAELGLDPSLTTLVVTGGSLGAASLNAVVASAAEMLAGAGVQVLHLTGTGKADAVRAAVDELADGGCYHVLEYLTRMQLALACADVVLCRSGAGTVAELTALGLPAVYVPLPIGNGEQRLNAGPVVAAGGGLLVDDAELSVPWLREHLLPILVGPDAGERRGRMGSAAASVGVRDAASRIADLVESHLAARSVAAPGPLPAPAPEEPGIADLGRTHLIGVGGAGMSAIASLLAARGVSVSGSDAQDSATLVPLRAAGVTVWVGHSADHVEHVDTVVVSTAVRESNPELARARALGLRVLHRSQALAALMAGRTAIAVAGAHGKTTTSAMIATALVHAGADPSFAIGGTVLSQDGPLAGGQPGEGAVFVAEADESDGSFLAYAPTIAVVLNVEPDHLDHYGSQAAFEAAFVAFSERIQPGGLLVACADDDGAARLVAGVRGELAARSVRVVTYGTRADADVVVGPLHGAEGAWTVRLTSGAPELGSTTLTLATAGAHNALNAAGAYAAVRAAGLSVAEATAGLAAFRGTGRRFEERGTADGVRVVDDYAHHPTEVAALLRAARTVAHDGRILVLFQPHLYSRTRTFAAEFGAALELADVAVVTDVYAAREDPDPSVTGAMVVEHVPTPGRASFVADRHAAAAAIAAAARPGDLVLTVGAGDVTALAPEILEALRARGVGATGGTSESGRPDGARSGDTGPGEPIGSAEGT